MFKCIAKGFGVTIGAVLAVFVSLVTFNAFSNKCDDEPEEA